MKKKMAVIAAFIIGVSCWSPKIVVMAKGADAENKNMDGLLEDYLAKNSSEIKTDDHVNHSENLLGIGENQLSEQPRNMFDVEEKETVQDDADVKSDEENDEKDSKELTEEKESADDGIETSEIKNLQIPQKLGIVIDPWEMDGRGQIYSEKYVIRNGGDTAGILTLSNLACRSQEPGKVVVRSDKNGLHDNEEKALYMEMWFGDSDCVILSEQGTEYQTELEPGEELTICFTGEVNEYASEGWKRDDVKVSVVYSWNVEDVLTDENVDDEGAEETEPEKNINEVEKDSKDREENIGLLDEGVVKVEKFEEVQTGNENVQEEVKEDGRKSIELLEGQEENVVVDSWNIGSNHQITSAKYLIRNVGEKTGTFLFTDLVCRFENEIDVKTVQEELQVADGKTIFMEMILGNEDQIVLTQADSEYRVKLKPGEEVSVQFVGIMNANMFEDLEENKVGIGARISWIAEE